MTDLSATPRTEFSIGRVFKDTVGVLRVNLAGGATVVVLYVALWHVAFLFVDEQSSAEFSWWNFAIRALWTCVLGGFGNAALIYVTFLTLGGSKPSLRDLIRGLSFAIPIMVVSFIVDLPTVLGELTAASNPDNALLMQLAAAVASYIVYILWFIAGPVIIAEGIGPLRALSRSAFLTADRRWPVFGLIFVTAIIFWVLGWAIASIANALNAEVGHTGPNLIFWINDYVLPAVALVFWAVVQTVAYWALRLAKEGAGIQELARVFD
jgi:hypothetical protein